MLPQYALLSRNIRCGLAEEEHYGIILECDKKGNVVKTGNDNHYLFSLRSCMKPLQLAAVSEIIDEFSLTEKEIAVAAASHTGEKKHTDKVLSILKKAGADEKYLLCPPQQPLSSATQRELIKNNKKPTKLHNNCSGKHAAILADCKYNGYSLKNYNRVSHPVQQKILKFCADICDVSEKDCEITWDGCTLPVLAMPLENLAKGFLNLFTDKKYQKITSSIINNPYYFGGKNRLDSELVFSGKGNLTAKVGAGNICCVVDLSAQRAVVIKLADGDNNARAVILTEYLKKNNIISETEFLRLRSLYSDKIKDEADKIIGETIFPFL